VKITAFWDVMPYNLKNAQMFRKNLLPPPPALQMEVAASTLTFVNMYRLHGIKYQKAVIFIDATV
jgi:hypothetical protein